MEAHHRHSWWGEGAYLPFTILLVNIPKNLKCTDRMTEKQRLQSVSLLELCGYRFLLHICPWKFGGGAYSWVMGTPP